MLENFELKSQKVVEHDRVVLLTFGLLLLNNLGDQLILNCILHEVHLFRAGWLLQNAFFVEEFKLVRDFSLGLFGLCLERQRVKLGFSLLAELFDLLLGREQVVNAELGVEPEVSQLRL